MRSSALVAVSVLSTIGVALAAHKCVLLQFCFYIWVFGTFSTFLMEVVWEEEVNAGEQLVHELFYRFGSLAEHVFVVWEEEEGEDCGLEAMRKCEKRKLYKCELRDKKHKLIWRCVWVHGAVKCRKDPSKQMNVEVRVYDKDGISLAQLLDPDDLMG